METFGSVPMNCPADHPCRPGPDCYSRATILQIDESPNFSSQWQYLPELPPTSSFSIARQLICVGRVSNESLVTLISRLTWASQTVRWRQPMNGESADVVQRI